MRIQFFKTLKFKLNVMLAFFTVVPLLAFSVFFVNRMETTLLSEQKDAVNKQLALVGDTVDVAFDNMLNNVSYYTENALLKSSDDSITSYVETTVPTKMTPSQNKPLEQAIFQSFTEFGKTHPEYRYISMGTVGGSYIQYPDSEINAGYDPRTRNWYTKAKSNPEKVMLGEPYYFATDDVTMVGASKAIKDTEGKMVGVMSMDISLDSLTALFEKATEGSKGYYMLATGDGTILADPSDLKNNFKSISEVYGEEFSTAVQNNANFDRILINSESYLIRSVPSDKTGWSYISVISEEELFSSAKRLEKIIWIVLASLLVFILIAGLLTSRSIAEPIKAVTKAAQEIADGNFDITIQTKSSGEVGLMIDAFQRIGVTLGIYKSYIQEISSVLDQIADGNTTFQLQQEYMGEFRSIKTALLNISHKLTETLTQIKASAEQIASGSEQVSAGSQALSQGATEQASSIEELSTTIRTISGHITSNARTAREASDISKQTVQDVNLGNQKMTEMIAAMNEINDKTQKISNILKIIDEIAFQTNILALNAAIEAASAGSAGKGFAVVADEVRNLAQKTAEATKSTANLIESSIDSVERGSEIVGQTASSLTQIVSNVDGVADLLEEIASASSEQSTAIEQISLGVEQISSVVQTNAATAEEAAASSEELSGQANLLNGLVRKFNIGATNETSKSSLERIPTFGSIDY